MKIVIRRSVFLIAAIALSAFASACGRLARPHESVTEPRTMLDDLNRTVTVPRRVTRIVSLAPNLTENVFAVGAGDRLVGVTTFCNYPEQAKSIGKVGDTMSPSIETILSMKPDVVLVSTASQIQPFIKTLESNRIAVFITDPTSLEGVFENLKQLGELFGTEEEAAKVIATLQKRTSAITDALKGRSEIGAFVQISNEPLFTIGKGSFLNGILALASVRSVTSHVESAYPKLSKETAIALKPDAIILSDSEDNREPNAVFKGSPALRNGKVFRIDPDLISRPGPRLVDAIEQIAKNLHPQAFGTN